MLHKLLVIVHGRDGAPGPGGMHDRLRRPIIHEHGSIGPISGALVFFFSVGAAVGAATQHWYLCGPPSASHITRLPLEVFVS